MREYLGKTDQTFVPRTQLVSGFHYSGWLSTTFLRYLLKENHYAFSELSQVIEFARGYPFVKLVDEISKKRAAYEENGRGGAASILKTLANSAYGSTIRNFNHLKNTKIVTVKEAERMLINPRLLNILQCGLGPNRCEEEEEIFQVSTLKKSTSFNAPFQVRFLKETHYFFPQSPPIILLDWATNYISCKTAHG